MLMIQVAHNARKVRPGGTLLFIGGTGARRPGVGRGVVSTITAALPALTANLALELAPIRVNLIAAGFVDAPLPASLLGDELGNRRKQLRDALPILRVVGPADVAALAVQEMGIYARCDSAIHNAESLAAGRRTVIGHNRGSCLRHLGRGE